MKDKIIVFSFLFVLFGLFFANIIASDKELSYSERRPLAQMPQLSLKDVASGKYMETFDKYATDQFMGRETFRAIKTSFDRNILLKKDTNGLFQAFGSIFKIEYPLREDKVERMCQRLDALYEKYLKDMNVYYSVIPDKNYYLPDNGSYLVMDYEKMAALMNEKMPAGAKYIDLFDTITLDNYYGSDAHWRQETLKPVLDALNKAMGITKEFNPEEYEHRSYAPFYGVYYGQLAGMAKPDTLIWLENQTTRDAIVTDLTQPEKNNIYVYNEDGLGGMDSYDVFLHGAQPLITIENPHNTSKKELILIRDSYGSSLAPLLLENYSRITLVDLRYVTQELLANYISFNNQDVLLLFSTTIINNSDTIR